MQVYDLLNISAISSPAFSGFRPVPVLPSSSSHRDRPPVHKRPRLDPAILTGGSVNITVSASSNIRSRDINVNSLLDIIKRFVSDTLSTQGEKKPSSVSCAAVYQACHALVVRANEGPKLYQLMERLLQARAEQIQNTLHAPLVDIIQWTTLFVQKCDSFIDQVVSCLHPSSDCSYLIYILDLEQSFSTPRLFGPSLRTGQQAPPDTVRRLILALFGACS